jgi:CRISPR-associated protein Csm3
LIFGIYDVDDVRDEEYVKFFIVALRLLEHSTLGGSGSRGYGQIAFKFIAPIILKTDDYVKGSDGFKKSLKTIDKLIENEGDNWHLRLSDLDETYINEKIIQQIRQEA